jgi:catechol-2,3-dioxygenase
MKRLTAILLVAADRRVVAHPRVEPIYPRMKESRRSSLGGIYLSHVIFETTDLSRAHKFYTEALGLKPTARAGYASGDLTFRVM